jgi:hypothetical protein
VGVIDQVCKSHYLRLADTTLSAVSSEKADQVLCCNGERVSWRFPAHTSSPQFWR